MKNIPLTDEADNVVRREKQKGEARQCARGCTQITSGGAVKTRLQMQFSWKYSILVAAVRTAGGSQPQEKKNIASCCEEDEMNSTFGETQPDVTLRWPIICWSDSQQVNSLSLMLHLWALGSVLCSSLKHAVTTCLASWRFTVVLNLLMLCVSAIWSAEVPNMSHTRTKEWHAACFGLNVPLKWTIKATLCNVSNPPTPTTTHTPIHTSINNKINHLESFGVFFWPHQLNICLLSC